MDTGNLTWLPDKAAAIVDAMSLMQYDLVGIGPYELIVGQPFLDAAREHGLPVVSVSPFARGRPGQIVPYVIKEANGRRVGFTSAFNTGGRKADSIDAQMPRLKETLRKLRGKCDVVVLLSHLGLKADEALAREVGDEGLVDAIIGGAEAARYESVHVVGKTAIVPTSTKGRAIGVLKMNFDARGDVEASAELRTISFDLPKDQQIEALVRRAMAPEGKREAERAMRGVEVARYAGTGRCADCHREEFRDWQNQRHSRAYESLAKENRLVAECLPCHSEHYRRTRRTPTEAVGTRGVQCTSCHGAGLRHAAQQEPDDVVKRPPEAVCRACHTAERDPEFDYEADLPRVDHKP